MSKHCLPIVILTKILYAMNTKTPMAYPSKTKTHAHIYTFPPFHIVCRNFFTSIGMFFLAFTPRRRFFFKSMCLAHFFWPPTSFLMVRPLEKEMCNIARLAKALWLNAIWSSLLQGRSSIVSYCDRSRKQLFCICSVVCCFKVLVIIAVIVQWANQRAASSSYWSTH